jgi:hypothetical protein
MPVANMIPKNRLKAGYRITVKNIRTNLSKSTSVYSEQDGVALFRALGRLIGDPDWETMALDPTVKPHK